VGIASGEAYETGGDYFGPVLNRVALLMHAAHGSQVLVAASTAALVDGVYVLDRVARSGASFCACGHRADRPFGRAPWASGE